MSAVDRSFPYYHDCPQSDNYQRYGLLDPITNRFIILSKSYASIKYTQILLSQIQMTSLIPIDIIINPLKFIKNRLAKEEFEILDAPSILCNKFDLTTINKTIKDVVLNNDNCSLAGLPSDPPGVVAVDFFRPFKDTVQILQYNSLHPEFNFDLQKKCFFIYHISCLIKEITKTAELKIELSRLNIENSLDIFQNTFETITDIDLSELIEPEKISYSNANIPVRHFSKALQKELFSLNYRLPYKKVKQDFYAQVNKIVNSSIVNNHKYDSEIIIKKMYDILITHLTFKNNE